VRKTGVKGDMDFLREGIKVLAEAIMDFEVAEKAGAEERAPPLRACKSATGRTGIDAHSCHFFEVGARMVVQATRS